MKTKILFALLVSSLLFLLAGPLVPSASGQTRTPVVNVKYSYAGVTRTTTGDFWTTGQPSLNFNSALIRIVPTGSPSGCTATVKTGPTAALATVAVDDANAVITCTSAVNKVVNSLDNYFNVTLSLTGGTNATIYVTLTNGVGWALNQTLSAVTQGAAAADDSSPWFVTHTDASGNNMPAGDTVGRGIHTIPGNGTTATLDIAGGVGSKGAGVQQVGEVSTLSAEVTNTTVTEVVAAPGTGSIYVRGIIVTKAVAATGTVTLVYGTGTNCGTGTTTLLVIGGATSNSLQPGYIPLGILVPATKALCLNTEAAGTGVRALTN